jgi:hypothetical protein
VDGYGAAAKLDTTTIFNARLFCNKQCHVAIVAALLVGNWTSLPSKIICPKKLVKVLNTHTHTHTQIEHFLPCLWCVKLNTDFPCCTRFGNGEIPALVSTELHQLL